MRPKTASRSNVAASGLVRRGARAVKEQAAETVSDVSRKLRDEGERLVAEQKERAANTLDDIGTSIREAAGRLHGGPLEEAGGYVEAAADRMSRASEYLVEQDVSNLLRDVQRVVTSRPQLFLGGMFLAGLALARFVKATEPDARAAARDTGTRAGSDRQRSGQRQR